MNKIRLAWQSLKESVRRNSATIGVVTVVFAIGAILFFQTLALNRLQENIESQRQLTAATKDVAESINQHAIEKTRQIESINKHLDCIVIFFSSPERTNKTITNIDPCTLGDKPASQQVQIVPAPNAKSSSTTQPSPAPSNGPVAASPSPSPSPSTTPPPAVAKQPGLLETLIVNPVRGLLNLIF